MAAEERASFSLLDRLMNEGADFDRDVATGTPDRLRAISDAIRRDLETLLNVRRRCVSVPESLAEARESVITFGIPDFSGANLASEEQRDHYRRTVEETIRRFEPRIHSVEVQLITNADPVDRTLRFRIEAYVQAGVDTEPQLVFDSIMEPVTNSVTVANGAANG